MAASSTPRLVYVAGYGRSGSTLLDMLLSGHPEVFGVGEVNTFLAEEAAGGSCSCGESLRQCVIWQQVIDRLKADVDGFGSPELIAAMYAAEAASGVAVNAAERRARNREAGRLWRTFYTELAHASGCSIIVDSSKTARFCVRRPLRLAVDAGLDVRIIHLVRDPRAVIYSERRRGNNARLESGVGGNGLGGVLRPVTGWLMANSAVEVYRGWMLPGVPVKRVRYEDLVTDPAQSLTEIADFVGVAAEPMLTALNSDSGIDAGHGVGGNRLRRSGQVKLRFDEAWRHQADRMVKSAGLLATPMAAKYGYRTHRW